MKLSNAMKNAIWARKLFSKGVSVQNSGISGGGRVINRTSSSLHAGTKVEASDIDGHPHEQPAPDFRDTATIYRNKDGKQLLRAFLVFSLCSSDFLVNNQLKLLSWSRKLFGLRMFRALMRATIYGQFMAGEVEEEVLAVAERNVKSGLYPMFSYTAPEVHGHAQGADGIASQHNIHTKNYHAIRKGLKMASSAKEFAYLPPQLATKLTYFTDSRILLNLSTLLDQQENILENLLSCGDVQKSEQLYQYLATLVEKSMVTYSGTGMVPPKYSATKSIVHLPALATNLPFNLELSRSQELQTFMKDSPMPRTPLSKTDEDSLLDLWNKMVNLGQLAEEEGVVMIVDAEQTYLQPGIECIILDLMRKYNAHRPVIHNTYQCYLKRTFGIVQRDLELANRERFCIGFKVVRGAYVQEERTRADNQGYEDPVNPSYEATTEMYERVASHLLQCIKELQPGSIYTTFATHNEDTVKYVLNRIAELGVSLEEGNLGFAQLLGMRDHITYALGQVGIPAAKLISYGVVEEGTMWLSRRVSEMYGAGELMIRERNMLRAELKRRLTRS